jgi:hypothetical protein
LDRVEAGHLPRWTGELDGLPGRGNIRTISASRMQSGGRATGRCAVYYFLYLRNRWPACRCRIDRQQVQFGEFLNRQIAVQTVAGLDGLIA